MLSQSDRATGGCKSMNYIEFRIILESEYFKSYNDQWIIAHEGFTNTAMAKAPERALEYWSMPF